jgi:hypothetical protein
VKVATTWLIVPMANAASRLALLASIKSEVSGGCCFTYFSSKPTKNLINLFKP